MQIAIFRELCPDTLMQLHDLDPDRSMQQPIRVLIVVDDVRTMMRFRDHLDPTTRHFQVSQVSSLEKALPLLGNQEHDVALVDLDLPEGEARELLHRVRVTSELLPVVALFDEAHASLTIDAVRLGVQDCISRYEKDSGLVARVVSYAVERHRMLSALREAREKEHHDATHDSLTALPNRHAFQTALTSAVEAARRHETNLALLFFDLDGFKAVNDSLGHEAGDALLTEVGKRLRRVTRKSDLVARLGGDEFVVALRQVDEPRAVMRAAEQFIEAISAPVTLFNQECKVGVSIGAAFYPNDADSPNALIRAADLAMYNAKQTDGNAVRFYEDEMDREVHERFALVANVRDATRRDELFLEYQPQIDVMAERLVGAEALLRWMHPERGRLAPSEFLGIAEDTGMIEEIGVYVIHEACRTAMNWGDHDDAPYVCVNVSGRQLRGDFVGEVRSALGETRLTPRRLVIEMAERSMIDASGRILAQVEELADTGITLCVDHFGAGAGSLAILQWESIRSLKLDRSLLADIGQGQRANRIVTAILTLARRLGLETLAEGVETIAQLRAMRFLGCARMQGFLLGGPVAGDQLAPQIEEDPKAPWRELLDRPEVKSTLGSLTAED